MITLRDPSAAGILNLKMQKKYVAVRQHSETICEPLRTEDYVVQPVVDVSPPKWHLAHTTWFWEEFVLTKYAPGYQRFHEQFAYLFNSYYESIGERVLRPDRGNLSRPTVGQIMEYRAYVDEHMIDLLEKLPEEVMDVVELGLNHEQQHQELLLTDIKYILGHNPLFPPYKKEFCETKKLSPDEGFVEMQAGNYQIGYDGKEFSYDNEHGVHEVLLQPFAIRKSLVTNGEYLEFMNDGGYKNPVFWHSDGWTWVKENNIKSPLYWHKTDGKWFRYALAGWEEVNPEEPVTHVSFYEVFAFAEWSGMRLPTEFEWEAASDLINWGQRWEHTGSAYLPYPGFKKPRSAIGEYNGKFMVNQMVLRGASIATPEDHSRKTYRNFFHPHLQWQFSGIRLCKR